MNADDLKRRLYAALLMKSNWELTDLELDIMGLLLQDPYIVKLLTREDDA
jgi:hypothetical protein